MVERPEGEIRFINAIPAEVKEIIGRAGTRGEATQVMCLILDGRDKNKTIGYFLYPGADHNVHPSWNTSAVGK
ncbi:hypothetical protein J4417_02810 [Candidatus Woesearchaeota archaeon]|nr:hypothetical protein [Candidatus Woesearchaeota archaeon]